MGPRLAAEAVLTSHARPLAIERAAAATTALLAVLQPVSASSEIGYQLIMTSAGTRGASGRRSAAVAAGRAA